MLRIPRFSPKSPSQKLLILWNFVKKFPKNFALHVPKLSLKTKVSLTALLQTLHNDSKKVRFALDSF